MKFTIGKKIISGFLLVILIYSINSIYSNYNITGMNNSYQELIDQRAKAAILAKEMQATALEKVASFRGFIINGDSKKLDRIAECDKVFNESRTEIETLLITTNGQNALSKLAASNDEYNKLVEKIKSLKQNNQNEEINQLVSGDGVKVVNDIIENSETISTLALGLLSDGEKEQSENSQRTIRISVYINIFVVVISILLAIFIARIISKPIKLLAQKADMIAGGDLTIQEIAFRSRDEVGDLANSFNRMLNNLKIVVKKVKAGSQMVAESAQELMAGSETTSTAAEEISSSVQSVSLNIENQKVGIDGISSITSELSAGIEQTTSSMQDIDNNSITISKLSEKGQNDLAKVVGQMNIINESSVESVNSVKELGKMSRSVEEIILLISNISSQTNLLALNAAIEAARAGEQGKGFSVVAEEVRKLADQSRVATLEISNTIKNMNTEIERVAITIEKGASEISRGTEIVCDVNSSFGDISKGYGSILMQVKEVSSAMQEMTAGMEEVLSSVGIISETANSNASCARDVTASIEEQTATMEEITDKASLLAKLSIDLESAISAFKV